MANKKHLQEAGRGHGSGYRVFKPKIKDPAELRKKTRESKEREDMSLDKDANDKQRLKNTRSESANIVQFLRSLSEKNYAEANKYLQASLEDKMKGRIKRATGI
tara:strand:- start:167 stop:478 length:312 start_codon:yes stop_codon:yes gene_type:complete